MSMRWPGPPVFSLAARLNRGQPGWFFSRGGILVLAPWLEEKEEEHGPEQYPNERALEAGVHGMLTDQHQYSPEEHADGEDQQSLVFPSSAHDAHDDSGSHEATDPDETPYPVEGRTSLGVGGRQ